MNDLAVIYEDNHLLVVNKASGMPVQDDETGDESLVVCGKAYIKEKYQKPGAVFLGLVHRIDRPVSGLVVLARTSKALERMNKIFRDRKVRKTYLAIVEGTPSIEEATLVHWLKKNEATNRTTVFTRETPDTVKAELHYHILKIHEQLALARVTPVTGRSHQIRAQMASIGCPIKGDVKYGGSPSGNARSIHLHAAFLSFEHPTTKQVLNLQAPVPETGEWQGFLKDILQLNATFG